MVLVRDFLFILALKFRPPRSLELDPVHRRGGRTDLPFVQVGWRWRSGLGPGEVTLVPPPVVRRRLLECLPRGQGRRGVFTPLLIPRLNSLENNVRVKFQSSMRFFLLLRKPPVSRRTHKIHRGRGKLRRPARRRLIVTGLRDRRGWVGPVKFMRLKTFSDWVVLFVLLNSLVPRATILRSIVRVSGLPLVKLKFLKNRVIMIKPFVRRFIPKFKIFPILLRKRRRVGRRGRNLLVAVLRFSVMPQNRRRARRLRRFPLIVGGLLIVILSFLILPVVKLIGGRRQLIPGWRS